jgi:hypothetical protein
MASNHHINGDGYGWAVGSKEYNFPKPVSYLNIFVDTGVTFTVSFDDGRSFLEVPAGFTSIPVGPVKSIVITADGVFNIVGVQA